MNVNIAGAIVAVRVGANNGRMTRKILLAELQAEGLRLFQGQAVVSRVPGVKADDYIGHIVTDMAIGVCFTQIKKNPL